MEITSYQEYKDALNELDRIRASRNAYDPVNGEHVEIAFALEKYEKENKIKRKDIHTSTPIHKYYSRTEVHIMSISPALGHLNIKGPSEEILTMSPAIKKKRSTEPFDHRTFFHKTLPMVASKYRFDENKDLVWDVEMCGLQGPVKVFKITTPGLESSDDWEVRSYENFWGSEYAKMLILTEYYKENKDKIEDESKYWFGRGKNW